MVGIVVASHGMLAQGLMDALELLAGNQDQVEYAGLCEGDSPEEYRRKIEAAIDAADSGDGVLALVDLFGGTPSNTVAQCLKSSDVNAVAGVNLAMLLSVVFSRDAMGLEELTDEAVRAGAEGVTDIRQKLFSKAEDGDEDF